LHFFWSFPARSGDPKGKELPVESIYLTLPSLSEYFLGLKRFVEITPRIDKKIYALVFVGYRSVYL
jgi:hypothetical protein